VEPIRVDGRPVADIGVRKGTYGVWTAAFKSRRVRFGIGMYIDRTLIFCV
jgi:hypothetical protein